MGTKRIVMCSFRSGSTKNYAYFTDIDDLEEGDHVEVTVRGEKKEILVVDCNPTEEEAKWASAWINRKILPDEVQESITCTGKNNADLINFIGFGLLSTSSTASTIIFMDSKGFEVQVRIGDIVERRANGLSLKKGGS